MCVKPRESQPRQPLSGGLQPTLQLGSSGPPLSVATCFAGILGRLPLSVRWRRKTGQGGPWEAASAAPRETGRRSSRHSEMRGLVPTLVGGWTTGPFPSLPRVFPVAWLSELEISPRERQRHTGPGPCTEEPRIEVNSIWMTRPRVSWSLLQCLRVVPGGHRLASWGAGGRRV